jgi:transposase
MRRPTSKSRRLSKMFADRIRELGHREPDRKPLKVVAFDEARFGLINWHRRRYCPKGSRPPYIVRRSYKWTYLYAAVEPTTGESLCLYLPGMDSGWVHSFLEEISQAYSDNHLLVVLDGAPTHRSEQIVCPDNVEFLRLPAYSPELDPVERRFQEFRHELSNRAFETVELLQVALGQALLPYWEDTARLRRLTGFSWWVEAVDAL